VTDTERHGPDSSDGLDVPVERIDETTAMALAIRASRAVVGETSPNPPVGAVVLDVDGRVVGVGATQPPGGPHAEVVALGRAGTRARGGTAVVTLEPCAHTGRTPPCTSALLAAGVARVVVAVEDPNLAAAGGIELLRAAGVEVVTGVERDDAEAGPLRAWLHRVRTGRPYVTWKTASTLDGRSAAADGTSRWITSPEARADVHRLRATVDAVLVGIGTALADDPALTVRLPGDASRDAFGGVQGEAQSGVGNRRPPLRVVMGHRDLPADARLADGSAPTLHLRSRSPAGVLAALADRGIVSVLLEGGPTLAGAFLDAGVVDRVVAYIAPALLGEGAAVLGPSGVGTIAGIHRLQVQDLGRVGPDIRVDAVPVPRSGHHVHQSGPTGT